MKAVKYTGDIERAAVKRHKQLDVVHQVQKVVQIFVFDKCVQPSVVPAYDGGDRVVDFQPGGFNIEERTVVQVLRQDPPAILRCEVINEISNIALLKSINRTLAFRNCF